MGHDRLRQSTGIITQPHQCSLSIPLFLHPTPIFSHFYILIFLPDSLLHLMCYAFSKKIYNILDYCKDTMFAHSKHQQLSMRNEQHSCFCSYFCCPQDMTGLFNNCAFITCCHTFILLFCHVISITNLQITGNSSKSICNMTGLK